ncbi:MAG: hypothetical protein IJY17_02605 [Alphaproteobacteria bacterium]|nr:hypothetical protein [Alphaproteobacteria bacterium]
MNKIFLLFLFLILPAFADAADIFNTAGSFDIARAVKLGRGKAYSVSTATNLNTGAGKTEISKSCSSGCSDCDTSTGLCNACKTRYAKDSAGKCHSCSSNCASCWMENGDTLSCETCDNGYELATDSVTGAGPFYCKKTETVCFAGYYLSGSNCVTCPDGTYSTGSNVASCQSCSTLTITESGSNISCGSSCTTTGECTSCPYGYYRPKTATVLTCYKCRDGCSACSDSSMGVYCTACEAGYTYTLDSYNMGSCAAASSGSNSSGSNTDSGTPSVTTCSAGKYLSNGSCVNCPAGTYSSGGSATSCTSCPTGSTSNAGASSCTICTGGYKYVGGYGCRICSSGYSFITDINGGNGQCRKTGSLAFGALTSDSAQCQSGWSVPGGNDGIQGSHCGKSGSNVAF